MVVIKIEDFDCNEFVIDSTNQLTTREGEKINLQFDWLLFNKYGVPKKDAFHLTEESRMLFECPIPRESPVYKKLKELNAKLAELLGGCYSSNLKEPNIHPPLLRLKIKQDSLIWENYEGRTPVEWSCADDLRKSIKFNSHVRFVVKPKCWHYLGKVGCSLVLKHLEARPPPAENPEEVQMVE